MTRTSRTKLPAATSARSVPRARRFGDRAPKATSPGCKCMLARIVGSVRREGERARMASSPFSLWPGAANRNSAPMGLKQRLGTALHGALEGTLASKHFPLTRYVPYGLSWLYDLQRFRGTRALGAVFDVGANTGQTLKALLRYAPEADIHSFEPTDGAFAALQAKYTGRANVRLHKMALGSRAETLELQVRADSELNTLVAAAAEAGEGSRTQTTEVATVDDVV